MITSKLTGRAQTTVPRAVRSALRLREGDEIVYTIDGSRVILSKASTPMVETPFTTFSEWASDEDRRAYGKL